MNPWEAPLPREILEGFALSRGVTKKESPWDAPEFKPRDPKIPDDVAADVAKSAASGLVSSPGAFAGMPGDVGRLLKLGLRHIATVPERTYNLLRGTGEFEVDPEAEAKREEFFGQTWPQEVWPGSKDVNKFLQQNVYDFSYEPKTGWGKGAKAITEGAVPAAVMGPGGFFTRQFAGAVAPGIGSEALGQLAERYLPGNPGLATGARMVGGMTAGVGAGMATAPRSTADIAARSTRHLTPQQWEEAARRQADAVMPITADEAIGAATGDRNSMLSAARRVAEQNIGGAPAFSELRSARVQQMPGVVERELNLNFGPGMSPLEGGARAQAASQGYIDDISRTINQIEGPFYDRMQGQRVSPEFHVQQDPYGPAVRTMEELRGVQPGAQESYARAVESVRSPLGRERYGAAADMDINSAEFQAAVHRELGELQNTAMGRGPGQIAGTQPDRQLARPRAQAQEEVARQIETAGPEHGQALAVGRQLRQTQLEPETRGISGAVAGTDDISVQGQRLMQDPRPGIHGDLYGGPTGAPGTVSQAVRGMVRTDPDAATNLARSFFREMFDSNFKATRGDPYGGARFHAALMGDRQTARNIEATIRSLPDGNNRWEGFRRLMETMEATGFAPAAGSPTYPNIAMARELQAGGKTGAAVALATSPLKRLGEYYQRYREGASSAELAGILTSPDGVAVLRELARTPVGSARASRLALRAAIIGEQAAQRESGGALVPSQPQPRRSTTDDDRG